MQNIIFKTLLKKYENKKGKKCEQRSGAFKALYLIASITAEELNESLNDEIEQFLLIEKNLTNEK